MHSDDPELLEEIWQQRAANVRRINRRLWMKRTGAVIAWSLLVLVLLAIAAFGVFAWLFHGVTTPI